MKKSISFIILVLFIQITIAQKLDYGNDLSAIKICNAIQGNNFSSESEADNALDKILNVIGASKRFVLQPCDNINNAVALSYKGIRYIMYDPEFMQMLSYSNNWSNMFVLAHEVGHHINGHSVDALLSMADIVSKVPLSKKRIQELEADEFAGFVLGRLGATLSDATSAVSKMSDGDDSYSTHPNRSKRIAAITKGFSDSGGKVDSSRSVSKGETIDSPYSNSRYSDVTYVLMDFAGGTYRGYVSIASNLPFGYGEYRNSDGYIYNGEWSDGSLNGYGKQTWNNSTYEGYFVGNERSGEGIGINAEGYKYVGFFSNNQLQNGVYYEKDYQDEGTWNVGAEIRITRKYKDGRIFEIGFLDESGGNGFTKYTNEEYTIKASFKDGYIKRSKKTNYINEFSYDTYGERKLRKMKSKNGFYNLHSYFTESIKQDLGIIEPIEINRYGVYLSDLEKNIGRVVWNTITLESKEIPQADFYTYNSDKDWDMEFKNYTYIGDFLGYGVEEWKEGSVYKGYFKGGTLLRAGYGELIYDDNDERASYAGIWWDNKKNGYGVLTYKNGKVEKGIFRNNEFFKKADFDLQFMQILLKDF